MTPPVDPLREKDARGERDTGDDERVRATAFPLCGLRGGRLRARAELRARRSLPRLRRLAVGRRVALGPCADQARLQLPQEVRVLRERLGELRRDAAAARSLLRELLEALRAPFDELVGRHFFCGGSSWVATRQMPDAVLRAATVAPAPSPA